MIVKVHFAKQCTDVEVADEATVQMLHEAIEEQMDIPVHKQKLICKGKVMADKSQLLSKYNVGPSSKVMLMAGGGLTQVRQSFHPHPRVILRGFFGFWSLMTRSRGLMFAFRAKVLQGNRQRSGDSKQTSAIKNASQYLDSLRTTFVSDRLSSSLDRRLVHSTASNRSNMCFV
jgi:Ubiquitin family